MKLFNKKLSLLILAIFLTTIITLSANINFNSNLQPSKTESEPLVDIQTSASPLSKNHQILPVSILVYTEYADETRELPNTMDALRNSYGTDFYHENLTDYTELDSKLTGHDILLIPEQDIASESTLKTIGNAWAPYLTNFVNDGGIIILLDHHWGSGATYHVYNESGLMEIKGVSSITGMSVNRVNYSDALARGISASWTAPDGSLSFNTTETVNVVDDGTYPVVVHKVMGGGHVVLLGFDFYDIEGNSSTILGNAIRLHRHVIIDDSQNPYLDFFLISSFVDDLVSEGFAVSRMTSFQPKYINACDVLVVIWGTSYYDPSEITAIETFVKSGGGLFIGGDYGSAGEELDPLLTQFGFGRNTTNYLIDSDDSLGDPSYIMYDNIVNHSITLDVNSVQVYTSTGFITLPSSAVPLILTDTDPTSSWTGGAPANGVPVAAALVTNGSGRVVVCGDANFLDSSANSDTDGTNDYYDEDNEIFAVNNIRWLSAAGVEECVVLFDELKSPIYSLDNHFKAFGNYLTSNGYTIKWNCSFHTNILDIADIIFISNGASIYTSSEINNITSFVASGGSLFLLGDWGGFGQEVDPVGIEFGIDINNTAGYLEDSDDFLVGPSYIIYNESNFGSHPITQGISRIEVDRGTGFTLNSTGTAVITTDTDGTSTWSTGPSADGIAIMMTTEYQSGRVVVFTDINFLSGIDDPDGDSDPDFFDSDNERLIVNSFQWLCERSSPVSGGGGGGGGGDEKKGAPFPWLLIAGIIGGIIVLIAIAAIIMKLRSKGS